MLTSDSTRGNAGAAGATAGSAQSGGNGHGAGALPAIPVDWGFLWEWGQTLARSCLQLSGFGSDIAVIVAYISSGHNGWAAVSVVLLLLSMALRGGTGPYALQLGCGGPLQQRRRKAHRQLAAVGAGCCHVLEPVAVLSYMLGVNQARRHLRPSCCPSSTYSTCSCCFPAATTTTAAPAPGAPGANLTREDVRALQTMMPPHLVKEVVQQAAADPAVVVRAQLKIDQHLQQARGTIMQSVLGLGAAFGAFATDVPQMLLQAYVLCLAFLQRGGVAFSVEEKATQLFAISVGFVGLVSVVVRLRVHGLQFMQPFGVRIFWRPPAPGSRLVYRTLVGAMVLVESSVRLWVLVWLGMGGGMLLLGCLVTELVVKLVMHTRMVLATLPRRVSKVLGLVIGFWMFTPSNILSMVAPCKAPSHLFISATVSLLFTWFYIAQIAWDVFGVGGDGLDGRVAGLCTEDVSLLDCSNLGRVHPWVVIPAVIGEGLVLLAWIAVAVRGFRR